MPSPSGTEFLQPPRTSVKNGTHHQDVKPKDKSRIPNNCGTAVFTLDWLPLDFLYMKESTLVSSLLFVCVLVIIVIFSSIIGLTD